LVTAQNAQAYAVTAVTVQERTEGILEGALRRHVAGRELPTRYCASDILAEFALEEFGHIAPGIELVRAIYDCTHKKIEYALGSIAARPLPPKQSNAATVSAERRFYKTSHFNAVP
jgi:hypothetical protein